MRRSRSTWPRSRRPSSTRSARPTTAAWRPGPASARGGEETVAFNRRFKMRNGLTVTHPGQGNPDIVEPAGPVDPEVGVIGAWDAKDPNKLLGCVVNFACHATTSPGGISANYIHYLEKVIQGYYGKDCVVVFLAGASGDVTQVDNRSPYQNPSGDRWAQLVGGKVGAEALKVLLADGARHARPGRGPHQGLGHQAARPEARAREGEPRDRRGGPVEGRPDRVDLRQGDRPARRPAEEGAGRRGRGAGRPGRPGGLRLRPRRILLPSTAWRSRRGAASRSRSRSRWPTAASATCRRRKPSAPTAAATRRG